MGAVAPDSLLEGLNEPQREAVLHGEGPLLILAGAGSGKTRVLTDRIAYLVGTGQAYPGEILAITFTNKAADEMRGRVEALVGDRARAMWVMTFHAACARMLRSEAQRLGYTRGFTIYDEQDFDDLLFRCVNVLELFPEVRDRYRHSFRHVLVDEYQDTNHAQYRWLRLLCEDHRNLSVVGDDDQSIYAFRGADIRNILDFEDDFPDAQVVKLEQNYRSTQTILNASNAVIANNRQRKPKQLWSELGEGSPVHLRELEDERAEARFVVSEVERLVDEGESRDEIAVFYRTNAQSRVLEDELVRYGVPYQVIGGPRFYERKEVKDALAYLTLLVNPADTVAFARVVNEPKRGIGATSQGRIVGHAN